MFYALRPRCSAYIHEVFCVNCMCPTFSGPLNCVLRSVLLPLCESLLRCLRSCEQVCACVRAAVYMSGSLCVSKCVHECARLCEFGCRELECMNGCEIEEKPHPRRDCVLRQLIYLRTYRCGRGWY